MRIGRSAKNRLGYCALVAVMAAALELLVRTGKVSRLVLSPPSEIVTRLWIDLESGEFWLGFATTVREVLIALAVSFLLGTALGYLFFRSGILRRALEPLLVAFYSSPALLFYPVLMTFLGQASATVVSMAVLLGTVPIAINVAVGFSSIERIWIKVGRSMNATRPQMLRKVLIPAAMPIIATGLRMGLTFALIGVVSLEFLTYSGGLGRLISWRYFIFDTEGVYSAIVLVAAIAIAINASLNKAEASVRARWA
jgi:ABC-type nitrate/sulfonate/bicarbonate transport system permease component